MKKCKRKKKRPKNHGEFKKLNIKLCSYFKKQKLFPNTFFQLYSLLQRRITKEKTSFFLVRKCKKLFVEKRKCLSVELDL